MAYKYTPTLTSREKTAIIERSRPFITKVISTAGVGISLVEGGVFVYNNGDYFYDPDVIARDKIEALGAHFFDQIDLVDQNIIKTALSLPENAANFVFGCALLTAEGVLKWGDAVDENGFLEGSWEFTKDWGRAWYKLITGDLHVNKVGQQYMMDEQRGITNGVARTDRVNFVVYRDPLILDLNGNGKIDVSAEGSGVYFDFNKDGIASSTGWLSGGADGDGLLVFDKNFDGIINDGTELFGDDFVKANGKTAKNGFDALASLDSDKDGIISALDPMYHFLKVWRDTNGDGISQADELFSLAQLGITGLVTGHQDKDETLEGGNTLTQEGVYINADGSFGVMGDVNFVQDFTQIRSSISA